VIARPAEKNNVRSNTVYEELHPVVQEESLSASLYAKLSEREVRSWISAARSADSYDRTNAAPDRGATCNISL
jgi:hypothetical protein